LNANKKTAEKGKPSDVRRERLIVLGLGPGDWKQLSLEARDVLESASEVFLRTARHPVVAHLPKSLRIESFDLVYEASQTFEEVYETIAQTLVQKALSQAEPVIYAVPGHPLVAEASVRRLLALARESSLEVRIVAGLSFLDAAFTSLELDPLEAGLSVLDALDVAAEPGEAGGGDLARWLPASQRLDPTRPVLICQVYDRRIASGVKLALLELYPAEHPVTLVRSAGIEGEEKLDRRPLHELDHAPEPDHLTCLYVPPVEIEKALTRFETMEYLIARLRGPGGCPWDSEQTHQSLKGHLIEEAYEVLDALDRGRMDKLCEEFGDLLLQIVLHAQIAGESDEFTMPDVVAGICTKLIRRHPHVFGRATVSGAAEVLVNWEEIKKAERAAARGEEAEEVPESLLASLPESMPALALAFTMQSRAARVGFDWKEIEPVLDKVCEEVQELRAAVSAEEKLAEMGDILFALVNASRWLGIDSEEALRGTNRRFRERFQLMEQMASQRGLDMRSQSLEQLDELWEEAKATLADSGEAST
jgi:tetrapyrrole methylase family protein / MazG family protein